MTRLEVFLSVLIGSALGAIIAIAFMGGIERGLDARDSAHGLDRHAIIEEALR